ncbi:carbohydrate ABC transporter membrane protein 2 (CUT1 family) [Frigoribacterium sp. PhB160]|jgi:raffinose/stachyose/melibiose transport system permease protein|uniref:carbohydrate ABC transporter permease n=1 Tax=Frigoribacterium sp. PhB160 TaxID=2485192 RepID=UPI000F4889E7|nr:carbohydrate ABC transporter permease [Frigoribacterium sp. PhB160]ROS57981.1 carbohydrate ABC transporter membrane protein 2 (CUT1 family) [Frigoribacterium sp. PhB160]
MFETRSLRAKLLLQLVVTVAMVPFVIPIYAMVSRSFAGSGWGNYAAVLAVPGFARFFLNSAIVAGGSIVIIYLATLAAAFGFSKLRVRSKEVYFWLMMAALTLPEVVLIAPLYATAVRLDLLGTFWAVILPIAALQIPFTVLITRGYVDGIPDTLFEAARLDGAGSWRMFWSILVPLARPMAVALIVLVLINAWNAYLLPKVFLVNDDMGVVTLLPEFFRRQYNDDTPKILAAAVVTAIPTIVAYIALQKQFERGMAAGAIK